MEEKISELKTFLLEANRAGYGGGEEKKWIKEADKSTTIAYESESGEWKFHDNFFGGEPYGGREVIFRQGKPEWLMVYYGEISDRGLDKDIVYNFLREALSQEAPEVLPVRGPDHWEKEIEGVFWTYDNTWRGDLTRFSGHEYIKMTGREIYDAEYSGGLVDQQ